VDHADTLCLSRYSDYTYRLRSKHDYDYSDKELQEWVEPITNLEKYSDTTYVLFNNHYRGKAAKNAATLQHMLKTPRPTVPTPSGALL
jgi:uncharacterized protein YecE (DUF72 family)